MQGVIEQCLLAWDEAIDNNLAPEFLITEHAELRLKQRLKVSKRKIRKVVVKAWYGKTVDIKKLKLAKYKGQFIYKNKLYRELMGYVFVFAIDDTMPEQKVLVTVF